MRLETVMMYQLQLFQIVNKRKYGNETSKETQTRKHIDSFMRWKINDTYTIAIITAIMAIARCNCNTY